MATQTKSEAAEARRKQRTAHQAEGAVSGLVAGAVVGAVGGPATAVAGAVLGAVAGALAGSELDGATLDPDELEPAADIEPPIAPARSDLGDSAPLVSKIEGERLDVRDALEAETIRSPRKGLHTVTRPGGAST